MSKRAVNVLRKMNDIFIGDQKVTLSGSLAIAGALTSSTTVNAFQPDVTNASVLWVSASVAACNINGFNGGRDGQVLFVCQTGSVGQALTFKSTTLTPGTVVGAPIWGIADGDTTLKAGNNGGAIFVYRAHSDTTNDGHWHMIASAANII